MGSISRRAMAVFPFLLGLPLIMSTFIAYLSFAGSAAPPGGPLVVKHALAVCVEDGGIPVDGPLWDIQAVVPVDVSVDKVPGPVFLQQPHKALKPLMGNGVKVIDMPSRGVGEQDVKAPGFPQAQLLPADPPLHLGFGIHVASLPVPVGTPQAQNPDTLIVVHPVLHADASLRRPALQGVVVVAPDVQQGTPGHGHQELQVLPFQVAAGQDQVKLRQPARRIEVIVLLGHHIGYC